MAKHRSMQEMHEIYRTILTQAQDEEKTAICRHLAKHDLFFLLYYILGRKDINHPWLFERCREVQASPDGHLDLWFRDGYKSTIITYAKTIQDILCNPNITVAFFACTRPIAKAFLRQIKLEFEGNDRLKSLFPDVLFANPKKDSPKWSEDDGIIVKRSANPKEATLEAWGVVDGQPTSKHFELAVYDDMVTKEFVATPEMIKKVNSSWELSRNLSTASGKVRYIGTRYHYNDTYQLMMDRKAAKPRIYTATDDDTEAGNPVLWTRDLLMKKIREMGTYVAAAQLFQNPRMKSMSGFDVNDLRYWPADHFKDLNIIFLVDPANEKTKRSDYTAIMVIGLGDDENYYVIDMIRDKLGPTEKGNVLFKLHRAYRPMFVGYEKYGMQSDIANYEDRMNRENYRFVITPLGGSVGQDDRIISNLMPIVESNRLYLPDRCIHQNYLGEQVDNTKIFVNDEVRLFPFAPHQDMLDALSRIKDPDVKFARPGGRPTSGQRQSIADNSYDPLG